MGSNLTQGSRIFLPWKKEAVLGVTDFALTLRPGYACVYTSAQHTSPMSFSLFVCVRSNASTYFSWECPRCFTVSPETGELPPKSSLNLSATFSPESALVYRGTATCTYYGREGVGEKAGLVQLKGVGKYPHVVVRAPPVSGADRACKTRGGGERREEGDGGVGTEGGRGEEERGRGEEVVASRGGGRQEVVVRFGVVAVGTSGQRWIELVNVSAVSSLYSGCVVLVCKYVMRI